MENFIGHIIGLDLVFSGLSGFSVFKNNKLLAYGLLNKKTQSTTNAQEKVKHSLYLADRLYQLFSKINNNQTVCVIEKPDWHQKGGEKKRVYVKGRWVTKVVNAQSAGRERNALKSLALSRGVVVSLLLAMDGKITPYYMTVDDVRGALLTSSRAKEAMFQKIRQLYFLDLEETTENMNITDAIALPTAFLKISQLPNGNARKVKQAKQLAHSRGAIGAFMHAINDMGFTNYGETRTLYQPENVQKLAQIRKPLMECNKKHILRPQAAAEDYFVSVDVSARHPGVVVGSPAENGAINLAFHKTYGLEKKMPDTADISYELLVAANLLLSLASVYALYPLKGIVFEYSDWHRAGAGLDYQIDIKAINSLFFTYGVLMGLAYFWNIPLYAVNATDAKKLLCGKRNATKADVKNYINKRYPQLKNEHTRDAALILEYFLKSQSLSYKGGN